MVGGPCIGGQLFSRVQIRQAGALDWSPCVPCGAQKMRVRESTNKGKTNSIG